jgi:hypothetical protein
MDGFSEEISLAVNGARLAVNVGTAVAPYVGAIGRGTMDVGTAVAPYVGAFGRSLGGAAGYIGRVAVVTAWATGEFVLGELVRAAGGGGGDPPPGSSTSTDEKKKKEAEEETEKARKRRIAMERLRKRIADSEELTERGRGGNLHFNDENSGRLYEPSYRQFTL